MINFKENLPFEECSSLFRTKFRNVQISVDSVVEEIIAVLLFPVLIRILVFCHTSMVGFLVFTWHSTGFTCSIVHVGAGWMKTEDNSIHT